MMRAGQSGYALILAAIVLVAGRAVCSPGVFNGIPPTRAYPLEDIGYVARGAKLDFDRFGRLAVIHEGIYAVLNDTVWINLADDDVRRRHVMINVIQAPDGRSYYGSRENWGVVEQGEDGTLRTRSLAGPDAPKWTQVAVFGDVQATRDGVCFASWNGIVYLDFKTRRSQLHPVSGLSTVFVAGGRIYVSAIEQPIQVLDTTKGALVPAPCGKSLVVKFAAALDERRTLLSDVDGGLWVFDGDLAPWPGLASLGVTGPIGALQTLVDGGVAVAVVGRGLYIFGKDEQIRTVLDIASYQRITEMANREPGVLWVATEDTIEKVLYGSALTTFGQKLGLTVAWPIVERWHDRLFVASEGKLFEAASSDGGAPSRFELVANQPPGGAWSMAAGSGQLLFGSHLGLFSFQPDGSFRPVLAFRDLSHLVMDGDGRCYAIGSSEIAVLEYRDGAWVEAAERVKGLPYTPIVLGTRHSAWVEMGGGGVARVRLDQGKIHVDVIESDPWTDATWVNLGVIGDVVILSASRGNRRYFDEALGAFRDAPELDAILDRPAQWIARARDDARGIIWASHNEGVITFTPREGGYDMDAASFDRINDRFPMINILDGRDIWISAGQALHHVDPRLMKGSWMLMRPELVSILDTRTNTELLPSRSAAGESIELQYAQNSLSFRFFAGSYGWRRAPVYEFRLGENESWATLDSGTLLTFKDLREGMYRLQVRIADSPGPAGDVASFMFKIHPPWQRTPLAYVGYVLLVVVAIAGVTRWSSHIVRKRNRVLEELVNERTRQLEAAMEKLNEETRNAATFAERNRLAGEVHDSLQQGLSGAILQLDSTLKLPSVAGEVRSRLNVVRNMISFTRQEVQHAVWDMESPLAEGVELEEALRRLVGIINSCPAAIEVEVIGDRLPVSRSVKHNLLRIAQEATTNAVRHASPGRIAIRLAYEPSGVSLSIDDDGVGFDASRAMDGNIGHFGLRGIRSRVKKLGGRLAIESTPGRGTSIRVSVPISVQDEVVV